MCFPPEQQAQQSGAPTGDNPMNRAVRKTALGKMVAGNNRDAYNAYVQSEVMEGRQPQRYNEWRLMNRHAR